MSDVDKNNNEFLGLTLLEKNMFDFYSKKNIEIPKVELFRNFTLVLNKVIQKEYFGDKYMTSEIKKKHFKWCWDITCNMFKEYDFNSNKQLFDYLNGLFDDLFYNIENKNEPINISFLNNIQIAIEGIFNYNEIKSQHTLAIFIDIYNVFDNKK